MRLAAPGTTRPAAAHHARVSRAATILAARGGAGDLEHCIIVEVEKTSWSSRRLFASIDIKAPVSVVWGALTDYDGLANFIPSLVENTCLERREHGALLKQVGGQEVAMGVKFSASCTLECTEFDGGVPESLCCTSGNGGDGLLPYPRHSLAGVPARDITFVQTKGDFEAFRGVWRMQPGGGGDSTFLCYSLFVQPQAWLPVRLIQSRITGEVSRNLMAVQQYAEGVHASSRESSSASTSDDEQPAMV